MKIYVASKSSNKNSALDEDSLIQVCSGMSAWEDALSYAKDHTRATDEPAWVFEVDLKAVHAFRMEKQLVARTVAQ